jgi:hypothetical protein
MAGDGGNEGEFSSGWREIQRIRDRFELPQYEPPRFVDGTYAHEVCLYPESEHSCAIRFIGMDVRYPDDWEVRVDGTRAFDIPCRRDRRGNMIYELSADRFRERILDYLDG